MLLEEITLRSDEHDFRTDDDYLAICLDWFFEFMGPSETPDYLDVSIYDENPCILYQAEVIRYPEKIHLNTPEGWQYWVRAEGQEFFVKTFLYSTAREILSRHFEQGINRLWIAFDW